MASTKKPMTLSLMRSVFLVFSYGEIASLWRHIKGANSINESTGSSHKTFLDADGRVVAGVFSHSDAMTYTKRTIYYIRDVFYRVNFGL